jgi:hypothetical protein
MASTEQFVKQIVIQASAEGVDQTTQSVEALNKAVDQTTQTSQGTAQVIDIQSRNTLTLEQSLERLERRFNTGLRAQQDYQKVADQLNKVVAQNPALQQRANDVLQNAAQYFEQGAAGSKKLNDAAALSSQQLQALSHAAKSAFDSIAAGQNPLQAVAQEFGRLQYALGGETGGVAGIFRTLSGLVGGTGNLIAIGLGAAAAAATALFTVITSQGPNVNAQLEEAARVIGLVKDAYRDASDSAGKFFQISKDALLLQNRLAQQQLTQSLPSLVPTSFKTGSQANQDLAQQISGGGEFGVLAQSASQATPEVQKIQAIMDQLVATLKTEGPAAVDRFVDSLGKLGLAQADIAQKANEAITQIQGKGQLLDASNKIKDLTASERLLTGAAQDEDRQRLGLTVTTQKHTQAVADSANAYDSAIQRVKDQTAALELENATLGLSTDAVLKLRTVDQLNRAAKSAGVEANPALNESLADSLVAAKKFNDTIRETKDITGQFVTTFVQGLLQGKSVMDSLRASAQNLSQTLATSAVNNALNGQFILAGIEGAAAIGASLFGNSGNKQNTAAQANAAAFAQMSDAIKQFIAAANGPQGSFTSTITDIQNNFIKLASAAVSAGQALTVQQLQASYVAQVNTVLNKSLIDLNTTTDQTAKNITDANAAASDLQNALIQLGASAADAAVTVQGKLATALDQIKGNFVDQLTSLTNTAQGKGFLNDIGDLIKQFTSFSKDAQTLGVGQSLVDTFFGASAQKIIDDAQLTGQAFKDLVAQFPQLQGVVHEFTQTVQQDASAIQRSTQEIASTIQGYQDQLFVAQQDQSSLAGKLAVFDLQAQRDRQAEVAKGGQALVALEALQAQQRYNIIADYNAQIIQQQQQAAQAALQAQQQAAEEARRAAEAAQQAWQNAADQINAFIAHFNASSASNLSPQQQLGSAQGTFATQLALAQGGNQNALSGITSNAQDVIDAAKRYYGSSAQGSNIINQVLSQLQQLPSQVDPSTLIVNSITDQTTQLVQPLNDQLVAMNDNNAQLTNLTDITQQMQPQIHQDLAVIAGYLDSVNNNTGLIILHIDLMSNRLAELEGFIGNSVIAQLTQIEADTADQARAARRVP